VALLWFKRFEMPSIPCRSVWNSWSSPKADTFTTKYQFECALSHYVGFVEYRNSVVLENFGWKCIHSFWDTLYMYLSSACACIRTYAYTVKF
jgi:hypothetical protein